MDLNILVNQISAHFKTKLQNFCKKENLDTLTPELSLKMITATKEIISEIGIQTLEHFYESFDTEVESIQENGNLYRFKYKSTKNFLTSVGQLRIQRSVYQQDKGGKSIVPLDRKWNMEHNYISDELQESILYSCAHNTPEETAMLVKKIGMLTVHPTTIKKVVEKNGDFVEEFKEQLIEKVYTEEQLPASADVLVGSLDGVNVLLNSKGKKKGRPTERPVKEKSVQSASSYKNAMCGTVSLYNIDKKENTNQLCPERILTKYTSRMPEDYSVNFKKEFEQELAHFKTVDVQKKIILTDAHKSIQGYIKENPKFKEFDWMIDFYHATEHLSKLSEHLFGKSSDKAQKWYSKKREELKGSAQGVLKLIRSAQYYIKTGGINKNSRKEAQKEVNYFIKHKAYMNYNEHIENGWPIGSGVVEAACKSVVKQRLCRSGQRWSIDGGQNILNLRTIVKSDRWEIFWDKLNEIKQKNYNVAA